MNEYKIPRDTLPKEGWIRGSLPRRKRTEEEKEKNSKQRLGCKLYNDGIVNHQVLLGEIPDPSWVLGKIKMTNPHANNGAKFYNDGITQYHVKPGETPEPHWIKGYIKR